MKKLLKNIFNHNLSPLLGVVLAGVLVHGFVLSGTFKTMDDEVSIVENPRIRGVSQIPEIFRSSFFGAGTYYRPLVTLSFLGEYHLFGLDPFYYNLTNLLLHLLNAVMVLWIVSLLTTNRTVAFWTAFLFVVHPVQWEAVSNIAGRSILLCAFWYLAAFLSYLRWDRRRAAKGFYILSLTAFALSLLSKESAVTFPLTLLSYQWFLCRKPSYLADSSNLEAVHRSGRWPLAAWAGPVLPFFLVTAGYAFLRRGLGITNIASWSSFQEGVLGVVTFLRASLTHLRLLVLPVDLHFDRAREYYTDLGNLWVWGTLAAFLVLGWAILKCRKRVSPVTQFFLLWPVLTFLPVSQLVPVRAHGNYASIAEHFLYLPLVGLLAVLIPAAFIMRNKAAELKIVSAAVSRWVTAGFLIFLMMTTVYMNLFSVNELALFERTLQNDPFNTRVRLSYALALARRGGHFPEAEDQFRRVLIDEPWNVRARISLGKALCDQGKYWEGIEQYEQARLHRLAGGDSSSEAARNLNQLLEKNLKLSYEVLSRHYKSLLKAEPRNTQLYYSLGVVYERLDNIEAAVYQFQRAVSLDPVYKNALFNLASCLDALGRKEKAAGYFKRLTALEGSPDEMDGYAYRYLGEFYRRAGDAEKEMFYAQKAAATAEEIGK